MRLIIIIFLFSAQTLFAQEHLRDTLLDKHAVQVLNYFENALAQTPSSSAIRLAYARAAEDYGYFDKSKSAFKIYLTQNPKDVGAMIDYALLLSRGDEEDRRLAVVESDSAKMRDPQNLSVLEGVLTIALVRLDSDAELDLDSFKKAVEVAATNLKNSAGTHNEYLSYFADSTLRWLKHYDDNQGDLDEQAGNEFERIDKELNRVYQTILHDYDDDTVFVDRFKEAERAWLLYRDAEMKAKFPYADSGANRYYGSVFGMCWPFDLGVLEKSHLNEIMNWYNGEEAEMDVCQGSVKSIEELAEIRSGNKKNK